MKSAVSTIESQVSVLASQVDQTARTYIPGRVTFTPLTKEDARCSVCAVVLPEKDICVLDRKIVCRACYWEIHPGNRKKPLKKGILKEE